LGKIFEKITFPYLQFTLLNRWFPNLFPPYVTNCGRKPFSEPETTALKNFLNSLNTNRLSFYVNCHTAMHFIGSVINIDVKPDFSVSENEKKVLNKALFRFNKTTEYNILEYCNHSFYGAGYAHH
jgi:hypothetical protein